MEQTFLVEASLLAAAAPLLYFSDRFPTWMLYLAVMLLIAGCMWRRIQLHIWYAPTPADWALASLFIIMLPIAVWVAPVPLRDQYSWPRAYILLWNLALFYFVVTYTSQASPFLHILVIGFICSGTLIAGAALLGSNWLYKFPDVDVLLNRIPTPLIGVFRGADNGFHPNQVSGTLLYVLPLMLCLALYYWRHCHRNYKVWMFVLVTIGVIFVLLISQSRGGLLGFGIGWLIIILMPSRFGKWLLSVGIICVLLALIFLPTLFSVLLHDASSIETLRGMNTINFRQQIWEQALNAISDFAFTGMGLGTFREVVHLLYPLNSIFDYDIAHAHNFFLQIALDFGLPGLIAILVMYLTAIVQLWRLWHWTDNSVNSDDSIIIRNYILGFIGCVVAQTIYSQLDAISLGAKTNFMFWYLFALIYGTANLKLNNTLIAK
jgi:putative inorganic carbon (HCO3(-)) transporter